MTHHQTVILGTNDQRSRWEQVRLQCLPDGIAQEFLHGLLHGAGTEGFVGATPEEKLEGFFGNG